MRRILLVAASLAALAALVILGLAYRGLPSRDEVKALATRNPQLTSVMHQREREARARGSKPRREQTWVHLASVSRSLIQAVVVAEDAKFFDHEGFDWEALRESAARDWRARRFVRGGSTITQQLAKNLFFTTARSPIRKLQEMVVTRWLEEDLRKDRILELYLNVIEWGNGVYGCEAAARRYYGKSAAEVDEIEAAGLAAMIPAPRRLNPEVDKTRHARAQLRVLRLMAQGGYLKATTSRLGAPARLPEEAGESNPVDAGTPVSEPDEPPEPIPAPTPGPTSTASPGGV